MSIKMKCSLVLLGFVFFLTSCDDDNEALSGNYSSGVIVVNEGNFGAGTGTLTHYNQASGVATQNIFRDAVGKFAGDVIQSLTIHDDQAFIVANGSNKIEIANATTFKRIATIDGSLIDKPRYVVIADNKAFISVWGAYGPSSSLVDSYVAVYDLDTKTIITTIATDEGTENLLYTSEKLFASNYNFGASSTISVIDPFDNSLETTIDVSAGPAGMVTDVNGKLWAICVGGWGATEGQLYRINPTTFEVEEQITITGTLGVDLGITPDKEYLIYTIGKSVYKLSIAATAEPEAALFEATDVVSLYTMEVEPVSGNIWIGDAPSFTGAGTAHVYTSTGTPLVSFTTGIAPTQFVFR